MSRHHVDDAADVAHTDIHGLDLIVRPPVDAACTLTDCQRDHVHVLTDNELLSLLALVDVIRLGDIVDDLPEAWEWLHHPNALAEGRAPIDLLDEDRPEDWNLLATLMSDQASVELLVYEPNTLVEEWESRRATR